MNCASNKLSFYIIKIFKLYNNKYYHVSCMLDAQSIVWISIVKKNIMNRSETNDLKRRMLKCVCCVVFRCAVFCCRCACVVSSRLAHVHETDVCLLCAVRLNVASLPTSPNA